MGRRDNTHYRAKSEINYLFHSLGDDSKPTKKKKTKENAERPLNSDRIGPLLSIW
jgi:hypothetical protein